MDVVAGEGEEGWAEGDDGEYVVEFVVEVFSKARVAPIGRLAEPVVVVDCEFEILSKQNEGGDEGALGFEEGREGRDLLSLFDDVDSFESWNGLIEGEDHP